MMMKIIDSLRRIRNLVPIGRELTKLQPIEFSSNFFSSMNSVCFQCEQCFFLQYITTHRGKMLANAHSLQAKHWAFEYERVDRVCVFAQAQNSTKRYS
jgi:hypothetical protein